MLANVLNAMAVPYIALSVVPVVQFLTVLVQQDISRRITMPLALFALISARPANGKRISAQNVILQ